MGYRRTLMNPERLTGEKLIAAMAGLGMTFAMESQKNTNIEDTVIDASVVGMEHDDLRVLGMLVSWLDVHHARLNLDRLTRTVPLLTGARSQVFWAAIAERFSMDRRWSRLARAKHHGARLDLLPTGTPFLIRRHGEDDRFANTRLRVPSGTLRQRSSDILTPQALAQVHVAYHHRIVMGASYRADAWAALTQDASLTTSALARLTYTSFATAWQVKRDFQTISQRLPTG